MTQLLTKKGNVFTSVITDLHTTLPLLLDSAGLSENTGTSIPILIKPNLVEPLQPPITTPVFLIEFLIEYLQKRFPDRKIIIGEGTGSLQHSTHSCFDQLGYSSMAQKKGIELVDLNEQKLTHKKNPSCKRWPDMYLPKLLDDVFLLSVPVLKAHTLAGVTLTMKNMMGCAPPSHYQGNGNWGKSSFHTGMHEAIFDLNQYRTPDFTLLDASIGMSQAHLWGPTCEPPINRLAASWDPVAIDAYGATLLKRDWRQVKHIRLAHNVLGSGEIHTLHDIK